MRIIFWTGWVVGALGATVTTHALEWTRTELKIATAPLQVEQQVVFTFKNSSNKTVAIKGVETSCSCLVAKSDRLTYAPGQAGQIDATFTTGDRAGLYQRTIWVATDESAEAIKLTVELEVPALTIALPRRLFWNRDERATEKVIELAAAPGLEIEFTSATPTSDEFVVSLVAVQPGQRYRVLARPNKTDVPCAAAIRLAGREKSGREIVESVYLSVD